MDPLGKQNTPGDSIRDVWNTPILGQVTNNHWKGHYPCLRKPRNIEDLQASREKVVNKNGR